MMKTLLGNMLQYAIDTIQYDFYYSESAQMFSFKNGKQYKS